MCRAAALLLLLATRAGAQDSPFFLRGVGTNQALGGLNANFSDQNTKRRDKLTTALTPTSCPTGQALTGGFYNNGYTFGGTCVAVSSGTALLTSTNTWSGTNSFTVSAPSSGSFSLNALTQKALLSGAAVIAEAGADIYNSVNVTSITFQTTGQFRINWAVPMKTVYYFCTCTADDVSPPLLCSINKIAPRVGLTKTTADFVISNLSNADANANTVYVVCFGGAEAEGLK